eukprot:jgi/Tetstr1/441995/TSEL_003145.t1
MPLRIELTETCHNVDFLKKLFSQSSSSVIDKSLVTIAKKLHQRLRKNASTTVEYVQKAYPIPGEGDAFIGRMYPSNQRFVCFQNMLGCLRRVLIAGKYVEVDMQNAHFQLLAGKYPDAPAIHDYISNREEHLRAVQEAAGVPRAVAKELFIVLIFGGSVDGWKADHNIPESLQLPSICQELYYTVVALKGDFETRPENQTFVKAAKSKKLRRAWQNTAFALWLQDLEARCMLAAIGHLRAGGVQVASLIHDGALISAADEHKVDLEALGTHVRDATGLECSFAVKGLDLTGDDEAWVQQVEEGFANHATEMKEIADKRDDKTKLVVEAALEGGHRLLAKLFHAMYPDSYAFLGKPDGWYVFRSPRWYPINMNVQPIMKKIDTSLYKTVAKSLKILENEEVPDGFTIELVSGLLTFISTMKFKRDLVDQLAISYHVADPSQWLSALDSNTHTLGFEDCVYDFDEKCFREGRPEDMISMSVGHTQADVEAHMFGSDIGQEIIDAIETMHASDEVLWYVLQTLATSVVGDRPNDRFQIWSGTGGNGKGLVKNLVSSALGQYYYEPTAGLFATRSVTGSVLSSELAKLKGKRVCIASEAEPGDTLRAGLLKQCTGHDLIHARDLYKSASEFRCVANIVLCFNEIPGVDDSSGGIERRLDLIRYPFKFVDSPSLPHEKQVDRSLQKKFSSKVFGAAFLSSLIKIYNETGFAFDPPESVRQEARDFLGENDLVGQFLNEFYEETGEYSDFVTLSDIWGKLRSARDFSDQMVDVKQSRQLCQKLRNKGLAISKAKGVTVLRNYKAREGEERGGGWRGSGSGGVPV